MDRTQRQRMLEAQVRDTYRSTLALWQRHSDALVTAPCGYAILSGPPQLDPELMIIGTNYGFANEDLGTPVQLEETWPDRSWLPDADWKLANRLRDMFAQAGHSRLHDTAIMSNFLFFRSPSIDRRDDAMAWIRNAGHLRAEIETHCLTELQRIVALSNPKRLLIIGTGPFKLHAEPSTTQCVMKDRNQQRSLILKGEIFGREAVGFIHLTGCRIARSDIDRMVTWIADWG